MSSGSAVGPNDSLDPGYLELDCICQLLIQGSDVHLKVILTPGAIWQCLKVVLVVTTGKGDQFSSVTQSCPTLWPHCKHARPPCPSPALRVHPNPCPSSRWCRPAISSSVIPFSSCPQSLPASESFPMSQLFAWGGQSTGVSALASFLPNTWNLPLQLYMGSVVLSLQYGPQDPVFCYLYPCVAPSHTAPAWVCVTNSTWQRLWYVTFTLDYRTHCG